MSQSNFLSSQDELYVSEAVKDGFSYRWFLSSVLSPQVDGEHQECSAFMDSPYPPSPYRSQQERV
jgi:hypothetical protein